MPGIVQEYSHKLIPQQEDTHIGMNGGPSWLHPDCLNGYGGDDCRQLFRFYLQRLNNLGCIRKERVWFGIRGVYRDAQTGAAYAAVEWNRDGVTMPHSQVNLDEGRIYLTLPCTQKVSSYRKNRVTHHGAWPAWPLASYEELFEIGIL